MRAQIHPSIFDDSMNGFARQAGYAFQCESLSLTLRAVIAKLSLAVPVAQVDRAAAF